MNSQWIDIDSGDGGTFQGYLSLPPTGSGPGILLVQEIFGVNDHIRSVADQYALDGFVVLAPDLFWRLEPRVQLGYAGADFDKARSLAGRLDAERGVRDLASAVAALRRLPVCAGKVASLGYCMGGRLAFLLAAETRLDAAVCYYPGGIERALGAADRVRCPLLFHFAERDHAIPATAVESVRQAFARRSDVAVEVHAGAEHGFNCWARAAWHQPSAVRAHGRTLSFLGSLL